MTAPEALARQPTLLTAATADPAKLWKIASLALRILLSGGLFAVALWLAAGRVDWRQAGEIGAATLFLGFALSVATVFVLAWRWRIVAARLAGSDRLPGMLSFIRIIWVGLAVNQVLPTVVGGDALRSALLARRGVPTARAVTSVIVDRLYGLLGVAVLCLLGLPLLGHGLAISTLQTVALVGAAIFATALLLFFARRHWTSATTFLAGLGNLLSWRINAVVIAAAVIGHLMNIAVFLMISQALGISLPLLPAIAVMALVLLATALPLSIAGWGLREITLVQAFGYLGAGTDKIILASVIYGLLLLFAQALGFLLLVGRNRP